MIVTELGIFMNFALTFYTHPFKFKYLIRDEIFSQNVIETVTVFRNKQKNQIEQ